LATLFTKFNLLKFLYSITLFKYNNSMELLKENDLGLSKTKFCFSTPVIKQINGKMYIIYADLSDDGEGIVQKAATINSGTLELESPKTLFQLPIKEKMGIIKLLEVDKWQNLFIRSSPDKSKVIFQYANGADNSFATCVTDNNLNILWTGDNRIEEPGKLVITSVCVDNAGTAYTGYKLEKGLFGGNTVTGHVFICNLQKKIKNIAVSTDMEVYQVLLLPSRTGNFIDVAGTCSQNTLYMGGVFSAKIDIATHGLSGFKKTDFDEKFINLFEEDKLAFTRNRKYGLYPCYMQIYRLEDESIGIIGTILREQQNEKTSYMVTGGIMNACFMKDKVIFSCIPKYMSEARINNSTSGETLPDQYMDRGYSSRKIRRDMFAVPFKNDLVVFYYDNEKNIGQELNQKPVDTRRTDDLILGMATISKEGLVKREVLFDGRKDDLAPFPALIEKIAPSLFLLPINSTSDSKKKRDNFCWGHIEIK
jgi:hypothetical protein